MVSECYNYSTFRDLCKEIDGRLKQKPETLKEKTEERENLRGRLLKPLNSVALREMHTEMTRDFPAYTREHMRCSNYKLLVALLIIVIGVILIGVGTGESEINRKGPLIGSGAVLDAVALIWVYLECDLSRTRHVEYRERVLSAFNDVIHFANKDPESVETIENWYSRFRVSATTAIRLEEVTHPVGNF